MEVTVIVPNYNGMKFLKKCMDSLRKQSYQNFLTMVVDNASRDESVVFLQQNYPEVTCVKMAENTGFCGAVNYGIINATTPYIILLNNDTIVHKNFVEKLLHKIKSSPTIFSVSAQMLQMKQPKLMDNGGDFYTLLGFAVARGKDQKAINFNRPKEVFSCCGGAVIYRRSILEQIGIFDEQHFAYLEDVDIGYRAKIHGYTNWYEPKAKVLHYGSGSSGSRYNSFKVQLAASNNIYLLYKNMPSFQFLLNSPFWILGIGIKYCFFFRKGLGKEYRTGIINGIKKCFSKIGKEKKVVYQKENLKYYIKIQCELIHNMKYLIEL